MERKYKQIYNNLKEIIDSINTGEVLLKPSKWAEKYRKITSESTIKGMFNYDLTPYMREIVDRFCPYDPTRIVAVMGGAQIGKTEAVIINAILYIMANCPGNIILTSTNDALAREVIEDRLDPAIFNSGLSHLIKPNVLRKKNQRTGDTSKSKEFCGQRLNSGGMQSIDNMTRQRTIMFGFFDDWEKAVIAHKTEGDLFSLLQRRFNTTKNHMKQGYFSTPESMPSNINNIYLLGDQRKWNLPCPRCGEKIELLWLDKQEKEDVGVYFKTDDAGHLIKNSVGYVCQKCGGFFKEKYKYEMNLNGVWIPTKTPEIEEMKSYYVPSLFSAPHMFGWTDYAFEWCKIYKGGNESVSKKKAFFNQVLGLPWQEKEKQIEKNKLSGNKRDYEVGTVPSKMSVDDGNGEIILITCAADMNGTLDDARLDYDVWAHSENGSIYSIDQGSIGSYQKGLAMDGRTLRTYRNGYSNNVWDEFETSVLKKDYIDEDGAINKIFITGIDVGYLPHYAFSFIDSSETKIYALRGKVSDKYIKKSDNLPLFKLGRERNNYYFLETDIIKDKLSEMINLDWNGKNSQPEGFMNFPESTKFKYKRKYFEQFESEHKLLQVNDDNEEIGWKWDKIKNTLQNHFFDTAVYNYGLKVIIAQQFCASYKVKNAKWADYARIFREKYL